MNQIIPFQFDAIEVRVADRGGEPWFVAADVCAALGIGNPSMAASKLDDDEKGVSLIDTLGGVQEMTVVNESGLYTLILRCRDATKEGTAPHRFRKWITSEVIPSIRKTGSYGRDPMVALSDPEALRGLLLRYSEEMIALQQENRLLGSKAGALDRLATASGSLCITDAAKALQIARKDLFSWLHRHNWIYRRVGGSSWVAYALKLHQGLLEHKVTTLSLSDGTERISEQVRVTPKGLAKLAEVLELQKLRDDASSPTGGQLLEPMA